MFCAESRRQNSNSESSRPHIINCHIDLSHPGFLRFQTTMLMMTKIPRTKAPPTAAPITIPFLFSPLLFCAPPVGPTLVAELDEAAVAVV